MERRLRIGVLYSNVDLGIDEDGLHPLTCHFVDEGKEKRIDNDHFHGYAVGRTEPCNEKDQPGVILKPDGMSGFLYVYEGNQRTDGEL